MNAQLARQMRAKIAGWLVAAVVLSVAALTMAPAMLTASTPASSVGTTGQGYDHPNGVLMVLVALTVAAVFISLVKSSKALTALGRARAEAYEQNRARARAAGWC